MKQTQIIEKNTEQTDKNTYKNRVNSQIDN